MGALRPGAFGFWKFCFLSMVGGCTSSRKNSSVTASLLPHSIYESNFYFADYSNYQGMDEANPANFVQVITIIENGTAKKQLVAFEFLK